MTEIRINRIIGRLAVGVLLMAGALAPSAAVAQAVIASVNDDPITNVDLDQHEKILRVLKRPATREAAMEDVIETRLKLIEISKFHINPADSDIGWGLSITARDLKMEPQQLLATLQRAGVTEDQWKQKWKAEAGWMMYVRALNRALEVSETDVRGELAREGKGRSTEYTVQQVIMVVPASAGAAGLQAKMTQAQALRGRYADCATGNELARNMTDTVVRDPMVRSASSLSPELRKVLDNTQVGHLTPPSRGATGIEMLAVCKKLDRQDATAEENVRNDLLARKLTSEAADRYREVRAKAIIVRK